jgi:hypothetical protein
MLQPQGTIFRGWKIPFRSRETKFQPWKMISRGWTMIFRGWERGSPAGGTAVAGWITRVDVAGGGAGRRRGDGRGAGGRGVGGYGRVNGGARRYDGAP